MYKDTNESITIQMYFHMELIHILLIRSNV